jgi:hypothetical protein
MGAVRLDAKLEDFGPKVKTKKNDAMWRHYSYHEDGRKQKKRVKIIDENTIEVIIYNIGNGSEAYPVERYREYKNRHGETVREQWNSWIKPKHVVFRQVLVRPGVIKQYHYWSDGKLKAFNLYVNDKDTVNVSVNQWGGMEYRTHKKGRAYFNGVTTVWSEEVIGPGNYHEFQDSRWAGGEERSDMDIEALPKMVIRDSRYGVIKSEGMMQGPWKIGEWTEVPYRCRNLKPAFYVRGVQVTEKVMRTPEKLTVDEILGEKNAEVRRIMLEQVGYEVFLDRCAREKGAKCIDKGTPLVGELWHIVDEAEDKMLERDWQNSRRRKNPDRTIALLKVKDGTMAKHYVLRVDPRCKTAQEANAWTWGLKADEYHPLIER